MNKHGTCDECRVLETVERQISGIVAYVRTVDLCPKHALFDELVEALENIAEGTHKETCDASDGVFDNCSCHIIVVAKDALARVKAAEKV